ncbi:MAG: ABC-F family ATP-binding cassette domain-containing protein, partial [Alphaproteobacteria bacterium]
GPNGAGKSTLLNIICGLDEADDGNIIKPKNMVIGYLPQDPNPNPLDTILEECMSGAHKLFSLKSKLNDAQKEMEEHFSNEAFERFESAEHEYRTLGGYAFESKASKILSGLGIGEDKLELHPTDLSGGWRMRLELAKLLVNEPDLLILDEPTNHLDLPSIMWLENYLINTDLGVLFVSHDEDFLNKIPDLILHLKNGTVREYHGNFDEFLVQYEEEQEGKIKSAEEIKKQIKHAEKFVDKFGAKASKAKQAQSRLKMIARMEESLDGINIDQKNSEIGIKIQLQTKSGVEPLKLENCAIGYEKALIQDFSLFVERGSKIAIVGANGIGKSTLLKRAGIVPLIDGALQFGHNVKLAYYSQDQVKALDMEKSALDNLMSTDQTLTIPKARSILGSLLLKGDAAFQMAKSLSGGEKSRLGLACLLVQDANFLMLDEPTNHLDMASSEILSNSLSDYEGTVMFVSHNRRFISSFATHILAINARGKTLLFNGDLNDPKVQKFLQIEKS